MPKLVDDETGELRTPSGYQFSAVSTEDLEASEYTVVSIVNDVSGSVVGFKDDMEKCLKTILEACQKSPRSENLLSRLVVFNDDIQEIHGFRILSSIDPKEYDDVLKPYGTTALFDATHTAIESTIKMGKNMTGQGILANAVVFVITDGLDNVSKYSPAQIKKLIEKTHLEECLESINVILIGILHEQDSNNISQELQEFKDEANLNQYEYIENASANSLAKIADFVSRSISSSSQALGTGGPSKSLSF